MLWSKLFIPTLRENPVDAESAAHRLLLRAGYIRSAGAGNYIHLALAQRTVDKIRRLVRAEMEAIGGQEFQLPVLESSQQEEIVAALARGELRSHKHLRQIWYQVQTHLGDKARQRIALDSYSFDADEAGQSVTAAKHCEVFRRILARCGVQAIGTSSGFLALSEEGGETLVQCNSCRYAAGLDFAVSRAAPHTGTDPEGDIPMEAFPTPGRKTIAEVAEFAQLPPTSQMKSLVMVAGGEPVLALVRGDHQLSRPKVAQILGVREVIPAQPAEISRRFGADPGSLGPVGLQDMRILADVSLASRRNMVAGANRNDYHLRNVTPGRDFQAEFADIRRVSEGDSCASCGGELKLRKAIQLAALRKLPSSSAGVYRIDLERIVQAVVAQNNDDASMILPPAIAPFAVVVTPVNNADATMREAAQKIYSDCLVSGIEALYDDRDERPGSKFKDADLIGVPCRITLGKKLAQGLVELTERRTRISTDVPLAEAISGLPRQS